MMRVMKGFSAFTVILFFTRCVQIPANPVEPPVSSEKHYYRFDIHSTSAGFSLFLNGVELVFFEGGSSYAGVISLNDWMVPGVNEFTITVYPAGNARSPEGRCGFILKKQYVSGFQSTESIVHALNWPGMDNSVSGVFSADNFPSTLIKKADILSGVPSAAEQKEITEIVEQLRGAFISKNIDTVNALLEIKNNDIASARFLPAAEHRAAANALYLELMNKPGFAVKPLARKIYTFSLTPDRRLVKVMQGREGFPEAAIILNYRGNDGKTVSHDHDLYFARISGKWSIIR